MFAHPILASLIVACHSAHPGDASPADDTAADASPADDTAADDTAADDTAAPVDDESYLYQEGVDIHVELGDDGIVVTRLADDKLLLVAGLDALSVDRSEGALAVDVQTVASDSGFDVVYTVRNPTDTAALMPDLQIPGVRMDDPLDLLNSCKMYMEHRDRADNLGDPDYLIVGSTRYHYTNGAGEEIHYEYDPSYGGETNGAYAPVIVATDGDFAVGSSLDYPFLEYENPDAQPVGVRQLVYDKLYPRMRLYRDVDSWRAVYTFQTSYDGAVPDGSNLVPPGASWEFTIPVRFSAPRWWLLTLTPYKTFFDQTYGTHDAPARDVSPVLWVNMAFFGNTSANNPRGWSWYLNKTNDDGHQVLPLVEVATGLAQVMDERGYSRVLMHSLTGIYDVDSSHTMYGEIPYQFMSTFEEGMEDEVDEAMGVLADAGIQTHAWWGIAGMMPVDEDGEVIAEGTWIPAGDLPQQADDPAHRAFALQQLEAAVSHGVDGIGLDAFARMERRASLEWLDEMKALAPGLRFAVEAQQDVFHTKAAIFVQRYSSGSDPENAITQPPVLAGWLNPGAEVQAYIASTENIDDVEATVADLAGMGYTPLLSFQGFTGDYQDEQDVTRRIVDRVESFVDVTGVNNDGLLACFNGVDDDGDGDVDWPFDEGCETAGDSSEE